MEFIDGINTNISTNIENNEKIINNLIIDISKNISENNEIDLILTEGQYFISSSSIDISNEILISLDKRNIKLNFNINN
jgi:Skp family chaperone for outer membrane proteins